MSLSITVRQTRDYLATDVEYTASKIITLPDPRAKVRSTTLSKLGFGTRTQKFWAISSAGSVGPGPGGSRKLPLAALRKILVYDEILGGPTLTVIETNDLEVVEEWHIKRWKERQRSARIARLKSLFTVPHCIRALKFPEDSESGSEPRGEV